MRVLIVDDDPDILKFVTLALQTEGHDVVACSGGGAALGAALRDDFDLALCDLNLPDLHGLEVIRAVKAQAPYLPIIVMSALDPREWSALSMEAGAAKFLHKPLRLEQLRSEVAMAQSARADLDVVVVDADPFERARVARAFQAGGCRVHLIERPVDVAAVPYKSLVILDARLGGLQEAVSACSRAGVPCFVVVEPGTMDDDLLLRAGASLVVSRPVDPDALLTQARFLTAR